MSDLENGWLLSSDFDSERGEEDVMCYCEWCERPIYYNSDYNIVDGDRICCRCYDEHQDKLMEEEMYGDDE